MLLLPPFLRLLIVNVGIVAHIALGNKHCKNGHTTRPLLVLKEYSEGKTEKHWSQKDSPFCVSSSQVILELKVCTFDDILWKSRKSICICTDLSMFYLQHFRSPPTQSAPEVDSV